ncbi:hypothetical protein L7F22_023975 [Adiantum nelumboides]|nr:hypothetical protein [Adiantum nelumboides]
MNKWVEAQSVSRVTERTVSKFVYSHICCRFGAPQEIISDHGPGFREGLLTRVCEEMKVKHQHATPYYPQSNGAVEKANGIITRILRFTPFHLVYGQEALQPIELEIPTIRAIKNEGKTEDEILADECVKWVLLDNKRFLSVETFEQQAMRRKALFDDKVKKKEILKGNLVLRYDNKLDTHFDKKFIPRWEGPFVVKKVYPTGKKTMAVNESRRTLAGYPLFYGEPGEDGDLFVADFKMALCINHIRDPVESLGLFEVTLRKSANTWFTALTPPLNQDFEQVLIAFRAQSGQAQNPQKLWKEILLIRQRTLDDYLTYRQAFNTAWTIWLQSLPNLGDGVEFLKKEQFTAGLIPTLRLKVESGDPVTYHDAERRAYQKYRKLKCLEEEPLPVLRPREVPIQVSNIAPIPVVPMAAGPSTQPAMIDNEVLERLNESLTNLSIHLAQGVGPRGTIPRSPQERPIRPRRVLTCWNCGEEGHGINNCPYPRGGYGQPPQQLPYPRNHANDPPPRGPVTILQRPNPPLAPIREEAPIPPLPDPGVHVVKVASVRPPAYAEALANGIKRTRGKEKEDTMREDSIPSGREHKREKGETSKRRRRRRINLHDFPLGHGMSPYNLIEDLQAKGPSIS